MAEECGRRRLAAILAADVVGYSRLMRVSEAGTLAALKTHRRELVDGRIAEHRGRIVKLPGDGMLVEFPSVVNAVACAVKIQRKMIERNADVLEDRRTELRIGANLADIICDDNDIFGDGVSLAARIKSIAKPGGVFISSCLRDNVGNRLDLTFEDMGEQTLKNIDRPVRVHNVSLGAASLPPATAPPMAAKNRTSIAILPFANMSGDPEQEYLSDEITEGIITDLRKVSALGVIARNTSFQFKGKNVAVPQIARQRKVSHILEGSVRKAGRRVRITALLIDGASGEHVRAERHDRDFSDIFALWDESSESIVKALKLKLLPEEKQAIARRSTANPEAYKLYLMTRHYRVMGTRRRNRVIVRMCRRALEIDAECARAWALLSTGLSIQRFGGEAAEGGMDAAESALALDPSLPDVHAAKGRVFTGLGRCDETVGELNIALGLDQNPMKPTPLRLAAPSPLIATTTRLRISTKLRKCTRPTSGRLAWLFKCTQQKATKLVPKPPHVERLIASKKLSRPSLTTAQRQVSVSQPW